MVRRKSNRPPGKVLPELSGSAISVIAGVSFAGQLIAGTTPTVAGAISLALLAGLLAVPAAGGLSSPSGVINGLLVTKYLLLAIAVNVVTLTPTESHLDAPSKTATVMCLGFWGLLVGTWLQQQIPSPKAPLIRFRATPHNYLAAALVMLLVCTSAYFIGIGPSLRGEGVRTGGILGIARAFAQLAPFSVAAALFYVWSKPRGRFLSHPFVLATLGLQCTIGIFSTSKFDAMQPIVILVACGFLRYGLSAKRLWTLSLGGIVYYSMVIFPYAQFVRGHGGREGGLWSRVTTIEGTLTQMATDPNFRQYLVAYANGDDHGYIGSSAFSRFAMIGEADRLIYATDATHAFTGWQTITRGFELMMPRFLYPNKPNFAAGNFLAHIAGDLGPSDVTTQVSYGPMANLYNAFGLSGVFTGTALLFGSLYYSWRLFLGTARAARSPDLSSLYYVLLVFTFQHSLAEDTVSGIMPEFEFPLLLLAILHASRWASAALFRQSPARRSTTYTAARTPY